jgi:integrase
MATIDFRLGLIRDRGKGHPLICYYIPKVSEAFMRECLKAHEHISDICQYKLDKTLLRASVLKYAVLEPKDRLELLQSLILGLKCEQTQQPQTQPMPATPAVKAIGLSELLDKWEERKEAENVAEKQMQKVDFCKRTLMEFFKANGMTTTADFDPDTAHKLISWRNKTSFGNSTRQGSSSASTIKKDLDVLKQLGKLASIHGYMQNGHIWDDVKVKAVIGVNKKEVKPLDVEGQLALLSKLKRNPCHHDACLLMLITGIRIGELETIKPNSIQNGLLTLHSDAVGNNKSGGKTASANRTLPCCPVLAKLFERGHIFKITAKAVTEALRDLGDGIHAHRLRHSFAVNNLLAQRSLQMVSYQIGHADVGLTANLYGKFVPEHFKAGFEETTRIRQAHLNWLENEYPL